MILNLFIFFSRSEGCQQHKLTSNDLLEIAVFISKTNQSADKEYAEKLPLASEAYVSIKSIADNIAKRHRELIAVKPRNTLEREM